MLITRCPACATLFKVVPDQLRISEGWVRCGHCAEVFDATAHFHDPEALQPQEAPAPFFESTPQATADTPVQDAFGGGFDAPQVQAPVTHIAAFDAPPELPPADFALPTDLPIDPVHVDASAAPGAEWHAAAGHSDQDHEPSPMAQARVAQQDVWPPAVDDAPQPDAVVAEDVTEPVKESADVSSASDAAAPEASVQEDAQPLPAFVRQADRRAFWRRPAVRVLTTLLTLAGLVALAAQAVLMEHDRIAAYVPAARPALEQACAVLGCEVGALRRIEAIVVDGSSFTRVRGDNYRLGIVLKNSGGVDIAMPSVELTLSNLQGQTVLRRVLSPAELGAARTLGAGAEWVGDVPVALDAGDVASRVAGYTVLPFYP